MSLHFLLRRPDVFEIDILAVSVLADGLGGEVDIDRAGEGIGHDQRGRGEVVGFHIGIDAAFEVAVAREARWRRPDRPALIAWLMGSGSGPELPMQVVQP